MKLWYKFKRWALRETVYRNAVTIDKETIITKNTHYDNTVIFKPGGRISPNAGVTVTLNKDYVRAPIFDAKTDIDTDRIDWWGQNND